MPAIGDAMKIAVPAAILGAVIGEWFGAERGLGVLLQSAMYNYQIPLLWSAALVSAVVSVIGYCAAAVTELMARQRYPRPEQFVGPAPADGAPIRADAAWMRSAAGSAATILAIALFWQLWITVTNTNMIVMPAPVDVLLSTIENPGRVLAASIHTAAVAFGGLILGVLGGGLLAVLAVLNPLLAGAIVPSLVLARSIPVVAMIPVIARLLGFNDETVLAVAVVITFFPAFALTTSGLRAVPPGTEDLFRLNAASRRTEMLRLRLPAAVPHLLTAIRIAAATSVLGALAAEWLIGTRGLGYLFGQASFRLAPGLAWSAIIMAMLLSVVLFALASAIERRGRERWT
jgi:NitT/TauT family transport system permease protein